MRAIRGKQIVWAAMLMGLAAPAGSRAEPAEPPAEPTIVQFELLPSLHIAVQVRINDAGPYRLIFDLGAPVNLVSGRFAADAGLITKEAAARPAFFGMRGDKIVKKFQVGDVVLEDVPIMIMDHPTIKIISEVLGPVDGIVGYPFFARYRFTIDYPAEQMVFTPGTYVPQNVMNQMMGRMFAAGRDAKRKLSPAALFGIDVAKESEDADPGVEIIHVWAGSPASSAGLMPDDRLLTIDGRWTDSVIEVFEAAARVKPNEAIELKLNRAGSLVDVKLQPALGL